MICSVSLSFTATIWRFPTQYPYEPVNNICVLRPISITHFQDVNTAPCTLTGIGHGEFLKMNNANDILLTGS